MRLAQTRLAGPSAPRETCLHKQIVLGLLAAAPP